MHSPLSYTAFGTILLFVHGLLVSGLTIPELPNLSSSNVTLDGFLRNRCTSDPDWVGNGIRSDDCRIAINELARTDVQPRKGQEYEFYTYGSPRLDFPLPTVLTPRTHDYGEFDGADHVSNPVLRDLGTCVVSIVMLDIFSGIVLPGEPQVMPVAERSDVATFDNILTQASSIFDVCVQKPGPRAGWSYAGMLPHLRSRENALVNSPDKENSR